MALPLFWKGVLLFKVGYTAHRMYKRNWDVKDALKDIATDATMVLGASTRNGKLAMALWDQQRCTNIDAATEVARRLKTLADDIQNDGTLIERRVQLAERVRGMIPIGYEAAGFDMCLRGYDADRPVSSSLARALSGLYHYGVCGQQLTPDGELTLVTMNLDEILRKIPGKEHNRVRLIISTLLPEKTAELRETLKVLPEYRQVQQATNDVNTIDRILFALGMDNAKRPNPQDAVRLFMYYDSREEEDA